MPARMAEPARRRSQARTLTAGPVDAALANGVMAHADETDDSHSLSQSHPGCAVVPAALAAGEDFGVDGTRFLRAVTLGYDVGTRVVMAMGGITFRNESHMSTHSIAGIFGAAAAAALHRRTRCTPDALDARLHRPAILGHRGLAARHRPHREGVRLRRDAGAQRRHLGAARADRAGTAWTICFQAPTISSWPTRRRPSPSCSSMASASATRSRGPISRSGRSARRSRRRSTPSKRSARKRPFDADQVQRVVVRLAPTVAAVVDNRDIPDICLQHMVAVMLLDKTVSFKAAHDKPRMQDAAVLRQRAKVQLVQDPALPQLLPVRVAVVELTLPTARR